MKKHIRSKNSINVNDENLKKVKGGFSLFRKKTATGPSLDDIVSKMDGKTLSPSETKLGDVLGMQEMMDKSATYKGTSEKGTSWWSRVFGR